MFLFTAMFLCISAIHFLACIIKKHSKTDDQEIKRKLPLLILKDTPDREGGSRFVKKREGEEAAEKRNDEADGRRKQMNSGNFILLLNTFL